jgi:hypothetical protein
MRRFMQGFITGIITGLAAGVVVVIGEDADEERERIIGADDTFYWGVPD